MGERDCTALPCVPKQNDPSGRLAKSVRLGLLPRLTLLVDGHGGAWGSSHLNAMPLTRKV